MIARMGRECNTHGEIRNACKIFIGKLKVNYHFGDHHHHQPFPVFGLDELILPSLWMM
jgi:hypothetical protein